MMGIGHLKINIINTHVNVFVAFLLFYYPLIWGAPSDSLNQKNKEEKIKKGLNFGFLPIIGFDSDLGWEFGGLVELYHYGDGSEYPAYLHSLFLELTRTTKGGGVNQFCFTTKKLIPGIRFSTDLCYLTEKALNFYGFNGYESVYNPEWENDTQDSSVYKSRMFYRHERKLLRFGFDFQGRLIRQNVYWLLGFAFLKTSVASIDIDAMNKGKDDNAKLPDVPGLYDQYTQWGLISTNEKNGGLNNFIKAGLVYDSRDNESNPTHGFWSEITFAFTPGFIGDNRVSFIKLSFIHRQYLPLVKNRLSFAYRIGYQGTVAGTPPFYFQPYLINSYSHSTTVDGFGGSVTLRGILRNRIVGDGTAFLNLEFRSKLLFFKLFKQNFCFGVNLFSDGAMVLDRIKLNISGVPDTINQHQYFSSSLDSPHLSYGGGIRLAMNNNFVIAIDLGYAGDKRDGTFGFYGGVGYLF